MIGRLALIFCAAIWCACGAFALAALAGRARRAMRRYGVSARVVFLLAAAACVMLAGGKGGSVSVRDDYIQDAGSYLTNDVAHVALSKKTPNLPDSTEILVYARELSSTNAADWFRLSPHLTYADHPYDYALPNATNYSVLVSSSFVPEPTVHTNGVWALRGFEVPGHPGKYAFGNSRVRRDVPYDAEVEYLESTGTQWIDTGVNTATISQYITDTAMLGVGAEGSNVAPYIFIGIHASKVFYGYVGMSSPTAIPADNARHIFEAANTGVVANDGFYIDGVKAKDRGTGTVASAPFYLFACYQPGALRFFLKQKKYAAQIYCNGIITRDFIPVRVGTTGYLYDSVSGALFGNAGTGDFIVGPDKQ